MPIEKYLMPNILDEQWILYKEEIKEFFTLQNSDFLYGQKRDNCGVIAANFFSFMQDKGILFERIQGEFLTDIGVYQKLDFYKEELIEMKNLSLNPNVLNDRLKFADMFNLHERQKLIPHYWNIDEHGLIVDLSGYSQFVKTGLSQNLNSDRYNPKNTINKKPHLKL